MSLSIGKKMSITMSVANGMILGAVLSGIGCAKGMLSSMNQIIVPALIKTVIISIGISAVVSAILGMIFSVKGISDKIANKLKVDEYANPIKFGIITALVGDTIMTPILCFIFIAKNVGFTSTLPMAYLSSLLIDYPIAFVISFIFSKPFTIIAKKISGID
jgi:hypothetical protein